MTRRSSSSCLCRVERTRLTDTKDSLRSASSPVLTGRTRRPAHKRFASERVETSRIVITEAITKARRCLNLRRRELFLSHFLADSAHKDIYHLRADGPVVATD